jgi:hypothetical protein
MCKEYNTLVDGFHARTHSILRTEHLFKAIRLSNQRMATCFGHIHYSTPDIFVEQQRDYEMGYLFKMNIRPFFKTKAAVQYWWESRVMIHCPCHAVCSIQTL